MSHVEALKATGKGYRYTWLAGSPNLHMTPPGDLPEETTLATDEQIEDWIERQVAKGESRADIEAGMAARRDDVASGYEDRVWGAFPSSRRGR